MEKNITTVFGGSGFVGRHVVRRLARAGMAIRVAVRDPEAAQFLKPMGKLGQIVAVATDIADEASVARAVQGAGAAVNLTGLLYESGDQNFQRIHVDGAGIVARAAAQAGLSRLVQISAIGAATDSPSRYARTKAAGEARARDAFPDVTILRPSIIFGPEDRFFNTFAGLARLGPVLPVFGCPLLPKVELFTEDGIIKLDIYGDGGTRFQPVYVGDVADAVTAALGDGRAAGRVYELGGPRVYSSKQIMDLLLAVIGRKRLLASIPFPVLKFQAWFLEKLPAPLLTRDQVTMLRFDNVVAEGALGLGDLGVAATTAESILPAYLGRFRPSSRREPRPAY